MVENKEWLEKAIAENYINIFDYADFTDLKHIGDGSFATVRSANWSSRGTRVALKSLKGELKFDDVAMKEFMRELKLLRKVNYHPNINQFLGVVKDPLSEHYVMVLEYADGGSLRDFLKSKFETLKWTDKFRIATEIARGLGCLHAEEIIHRDLHSKNILVHKGKMMIADFGLSRQINDNLTHSNSMVREMSQYIDPQCYKSPNYKRDKRSDIYSLGVLLWEISSGRPPFASVPNDKLSIEIFIGNREVPIDGTPETYVQLYTQCWHDKPEKRPDIKEVLVILNKLYVTAKTQSGIFSQDIQFHSNNNQISVYKSSSTRSSFENDDSRNDVTETLNKEIKTSIYSGLEPRNTAFSEISNFQICNQAVNTRRRSLSPIRGQPSKDYWKEKLSVIKENYTVNLSNNLSLEEETYSKLFSGTKPMPHVNNLYSFPKKCSSRSKNLKQTVSVSDFKITNSYSPDDQIDNLIPIVFNQEVGYHQENDFVLYNGKPMESITPVIDDMHAIVIKEQPFFIPYSQFNIIAPLDYGYLGRSFKVHWKKANNVVALKKLYLKEETRDNFLEDILKEIKIHSNIEMCKNINRLLGITHDVVNNIYMLITEYADKGNLRKYLKNNSSFMTWKQKVDFALQITNGIQYLHSENIIHGNLHSKSILINDHRNIIKITEFGFTRSLESDPLKSHLGVIAYIAPELLKPISISTFLHDNSKSVGLSKSTDIYSLGILYWELVSGYPPFKNSNEIKLVEEICAGKRERRIPGTPNEYFELYSECWSGQSESRPNIEEIYRNLTKMMERINREGKLEINLICFLDKY
ncbi:kinase-like protein [Gigaspora margarita]|uniref:Kinase-like protein n=1 Tax=Gigaspora margarita TaxID=4874 RepID=A0A8H4AG75_GIGMA|nr:kinase-like protein [Gigaspora margarita]